MMSIARQPVFRLPLVRLGTALRQAFHATAGGDGDLDAVRDRRALLDDMLTRSPDAFSCEEDILALMQSLPGH